MLKTVEVPLAGHADKICDQIVDGIVDEYLRRDTKSTVDIQALGSHGMIMIGGTVDSRADFDAAEIVRRVYKRIGFTDDLEPFVNIERPGEDQSRTLVKGGAQGTSVVTGYATRETREFMPRAAVYANALARRLHELRLNDAAFAWLRPDGKVQLTMEGDRPIAVSVLVQHEEGIDAAHIQQQIVDAAIIPVLGMHEGIKMYVNSGGAFTIGGFSITGGASGRKTLVDTYGGLMPNGGSTLSGKDPYKPSRAGTYMARFAARQLVEEGLAGNVLIKAGYALGRPEPIFLQATSGKGEDLTPVVRERFDFRPDAIVERLGLTVPIYEQASLFGYFGKEGAPWEG